MSKEEIKKDIEEYVEFNKKNTRDFYDKQGEIEKKYNVKDNGTESEYYDVILDGEMEVSSDWSGDGMEYEILENKDYSDEEIEKLEEKAEKFNVEYTGNLDNFYDRARKFWEDKGYCVDFEDITTYLSKGDYRAFGYTFENESGDDFTIEEDKEE